MDFYLAVALGCVFFAACTAWATIKGLRIPEPEPLGCH